MGLPETSSGRGGRFLGPTLAGLAMEHLPHGLVLVGRQPAVRGRRIALPSGCGVNRAFLQETSNGMQ